jgi:hypothetical protein
MQSVRSFGSNIHPSPAANTVLRTAIQKKMSVGASNEIGEKNAITDEATGMVTSQPISFPFNTINRKCAHCEAEEKKEQLQRKDNGSESVSSAPSIVDDVLSSSSGKPMDSDTRSFMENRFHYDFSGVKIHDDDLAAKSADSINALAYASGNDIVFNSGQYNTSSDAGKRLLAHELTHVMQQEHLKNSISTFVQREEDCESREWPKGCSAPGGCDAGKKCVAMQEWSKCACWDAAAEQRMRESVPAWIIALLGSAALLALIACFATGVCEVAVIVAGLGAATAAVLIAVLRSLGLIGSDQGTVAQNEGVDNSESDLNEEV